MTKKQVLNMWEKSFRDVEKMGAKKMEICDAYLAGKIDSEEYDRRIEEIQKVYKITDKYCTDLWNLYCEM